jgi:hypothetical protein
VARTKRVVKTWIAMNIRIPTSFDRILIVGLIPSIQKTSDEDIDQFGIELLSLLFLEDRDGVILRKGSSIRSFGGHGVVGVHYGNDPSPQFDLVSLHSIRVSSSIKPLMMVANDGSGGLQKRNHSDNIFALSRVFHDFSIFLFREISILLDDGIGDSDFPDIM